MGKRSEKGRGEGKEEKECRKNMGEKHPPRK